MLTHQAMLDLVEYLKIRKELIDLNIDINNVFLTKYKNTFKPINIRTIQNIIKKYADAYDKHHITAQNLRHSFATRLYNKTQNVDFIKQQLGIDAINPIWVYGHIINSNK
jgi:integrase